MATVAFSQLRVNAGSSAGSHQDVSRNSSLNLRYFASSRFLSSSVSRPGHRSSRVSQHSRCEQVQVRAVSSENIEQWNSEARTQRLAHLEEQALSTLKHTLGSFERPTFPCALIAGDVVLLDLLHRLGAFEMDKFKVVFIDTYHLFPETYQFLAECEARYGFKAEVFHAADVSSKDEFNAKFGSDLFIVDIDEYDKICKVEPFGRALKSLQVDAMVNGRRRDHGADRAHLEVFEGGDMVKVQPLAYWEFRDCFEYLEVHGLPAHPLHSQGFPSIGDFMTTLPVPKDKWFEYGGERAGRFQGLTNKDGSEKTECGIHVGDAREVGKVN